MLIRAFFFALKLKCVKINCQIISLNISIVRWVCKAVIFYDYRSIMVLAKGVFYDKHTEVKVMCEAICVAVGAKCEL